MNAGVVSLFGPRDQVLAELNARQQQAQRHAMPAGASVAAVDTGKDEDNES
jgi:ATP-binding cassette subfamily C protein EexD